MKKLFILLFAALLVMAFSVPAMAKFNIGAVIATDFYYVKQDAENKSGGIASVNGVPAPVRDDDYSYVRINMPNWSNFNITWTNEKDVRARFELAAGDIAGTSGFGQNFTNQTLAAMGVAPTSTEGADQEGVNMRFMYGEWDATPNFTLRAGWSTTPFSPLAPNQSLGTRSQAGAHIILLGFGEFYSGRGPQIRGTYKFSDMFKFEMALIDPSVNGPNVFAPVVVNGVPYVSDNESKLPRIDLAADITLGPVKLYPSLFYHRQTFDNVGPMSENDLTSTGYSLGISFSIGPLGFRGEFQWGENWANTRSTGAGLWPARVITANGVTNVYDTDDMGWWAEVFFNFGPVTPHLMYGARDSENDGLPTPNDDLDRKMDAIVLRVDIPVAKVFYLRPEIGWYDYDSSAKVGAGSNVAMDFGKQVIYGVQFLVVF